MKYLNALAEDINRISTAHGFWPEEGRNFGEMIALAHSELSEALEANRDSEPPVWYKHAEGCLHEPLNGVHDVMHDRGGCTCGRKPEGAAVELADCIIRCLDTMYSLDIDIDAVVRRKMEYNESRPYKHGRQY